jgi:hypothetical protein
LIQQAQYTYFIAALVFVVAVERQGRVVVDLSQHLLGVAAVVLLVVVEVLGALGVMVILNYNIMYGNKWGNSKWA